MVAIEYRLGVVNTWVLVWPVSPGFSMSPGRRGVFGALRTGQSCSRDRVPSTWGILLSEQHISVAKWVRVNEL